MNNFYTYELCSSATPWLPFYVGKGTPKEVCDKISKSTKGRIAWNKGKTLGNRIKESKINRG